MSSGTGSIGRSKHFVSDISIYEQSFRRAYELQFGDTKNQVILALLPNYIEQGNSSLVEMVNDLGEDEMKLLGLLVEQYLAFAETMAQQQTPMYMNDWMQRLDSILQLNGRELLTHAGKISHQMAVEKSSSEFLKFKEKSTKIEFEQSLKEIEADIKKLSGK